MARVRHIMLCLLAVLGLVSTLGWTNTASACPLEKQASHASMMHHGHQAPRTPVGGDMPVCGVCMAVMPPLALIEFHPFAVVAPLVSGLAALAGIHPELDPPPPRGA